MYCLLVKSAKPLLNTSTAKKNNNRFSLKNTTFESLVGDGKRTFLTRWDRFAKSYKYKYNGKEWQDELGLNMYDYGARNYDPAIGRFMNMDALSDRYVGLSNYSYTYNNPILFIDPDGNQIDDSFIYQKDKNGKYVSPALVKAWESFAKSKNGIAFLSNFAAKGQVIAGHKYEESGKFDQKNVDLKFGKLPDDDPANAKTIDNQTKDGLQITVLLWQNDRDVARNIKEIGHEGFIHAEKTAEDYEDDGDLNYSNIDKDIVKYASDAVKNGYPKKYQTNLIQHTQEKRDKTLDKKLLPILQAYYKNNNMQVPVESIKRTINGYRR